LQNKFDSNGAYFKGGALYIVARTNSSTDLTNSSHSVGDRLYQCGGYLFEQNTFKYTIGCPSLAGATLFF
jgi:hypothetical protein